MRQIGTISDSQQAQRFADYLLAQGIKSSVQKEAEDWCIWVNDEDQLQAARDALQEFRQNPNASAYSDAQAEANKIRKEAEIHRATRAKQTINVRREVWAQPTAKKIPLTMVIIGISIAVTIFSDQGRLAGNSPMRELSFCDKTHTKELNFDSARDGLIDIKGGEFWRTVTPIFIHYDIMHIAFNMLWFYQLAGMIEVRRSSALLGAMILVIALLSNFGQFFFEGSPWFGGMSGVVYGLLGFVWVRMVQFPQEGLRISQQSVTFMVGWLVLCFTGAMEHFGIHVANWAHLFGLLVGAAFAFLLPAKSRKRKA